VLDARNAGSDLGRLSWSSVLARRSVCI